MRRASLCGRDWSRRTQPPALGRPQQIRRRRAEPFSSLLAPGAPGCSNGKGRCAPGDLSKDSGRPESLLRSPGAQRPFPFEQPGAPGARREEKGSALLRRICWGLPNAGGCVRRDQSLPQRDALLKARRHRSSHLPHPCFRPSLGQGHRGSKEAQRSYLEAGDELPRLWTIRLNRGHSKAVSGNCFLLDKGPQTWDFILTSPSASLP